VAAGQIQRLRKVMVTRAEFCPREMAGACLHLA
jgi:hypothetical protein